MRPWILSVVVLCATVVASAPAQPPAKTGADTAAVAQGNNVFAFDLYHHLAKKDGNLFFSPYSISTALGMTYAGARGETAEQMARTLHFGLGQDRLHRGFAGLIRELNAAKDRKYQLYTANALWGQRGATFLPDFLGVTKDDYGAGFRELDFARETEAARKAINAWVEEQTKDKIKELLKPGVLSPQTMLVLTNAIYFKAGWLSAFPEGATRKADFHLANGTKIQVPTMHHGHDFNYYDGGTFQMLELPYERHDLDMLVLLPKKVGSLAELEKSLTSARLDEWRGRLTRHEVQVALPKFKVTSEFSLKKTLSDMGMQVAFTQGRADFSGMTTQARLWIDEVIHKAFVDVHEKGTEAAAATAVIMKAESASSSPAATFRADRPFVFLIRDRATGSTLFMGRVADPR
jgi:serpin B